MRHRTLYTILMVLYTSFSSGCEESGQVPPARNEGAQESQGEWLGEALREHLANADRLVVRQSWPTKRFTFVEQHLVSRGTSVFEHQIVLHLLDDDGRPAGSVDLIQKRYLALEDGYYASMSSPYLSEEEIDGVLRPWVSVSVRHRTEWASGDGRPRPERFPVGERFGRAVFIGTDHGFKLDPEQSDWTEEELAEIGKRSPIWWKD